jgi:phenylalanine-4-hydroxylase
MTQQTSPTPAYTAKQPDINGYIPYTAEEDSVWRDLYKRQIKIVEGRACDEYMHGLELLNLPQDRVPQCEDVSAVLRRLTGWSIAPVAALIPFDEFFKLLANRQFPAASFIRSRAELDYLKEPDIFHEVFGHCPLLTNHAYADFVHKYGEIGLHANAKDRALIARLFWFTIEFGLVNTSNGLRIYGAGILSSKEETVYALEDPLPQRKLFDPLEALRTPYRYDMLQQIYYVLDHYDTLYDLLKIDIIALINESRRLGEYSATFTPTVQNGC